MNFSKVKLLICICLFAVNVVFSFLLIRLVNEKNYLPEEEAVLAGKHLAKNGIHVDYDKDGRRLYNLPVYEVPNSDESTIPEACKKLTEAFFATAVEDSAFVKTPDGYSVSIKNKDEKLIGTASLSLDKHFKCSSENAVTDKETEEISKMPCLRSLETAKNNETSTARKFVDMAFRGTDIKYQMLGSEQYNGGEVVCFEEILSGKRVINMYLNVYVKNGKILCCVGKIPENEAEKKYSTKLIDSVDIMYLLPEHIREIKNTDVIENISVKNYEIGYKMFDYNGNTDYIIPVWMIEYTCNGSESEIMVIDAVTGMNMEKLK